LVRGEGEIVDKARGHVNAPATGRQRPARTCESGWYTAPKVLMSDSHRSEGRQTADELNRITSQVPTLAIIGRPNVGKSTLFNRLLGRRQSIVHNLPGVTRDRIAGRTRLGDDFPVELVDTGGLVPGDDPLGLSAQVFLAIEESDLLLLVVDGKEGLTTADETVAANLRRFAKPVLVVVNKSDTRAAREQVAEFHRLGMGEPILVSAEHGDGIGELREAAQALLPAPEPLEQGDSLPSFAIVGRPNVGKSSLVNQLLGETRVLVSPVAGTTRDPVDSLLEWNERTFRLVDTAGIRRRSQVSGVAEEIAVLFARRQMDSAQVVVVVIDASRGVTTGDMAIAGEAWELGRGVVVAFNKWDLVDDEARERVEASWPRIAELLAEPERVNLSALTGRHVDRLMPAVARTLDRCRLELGTGEINRIFERAVAQHTPPSLRGKAWKLYYATQVGKAPPTFMLFANHPLERQNTYRRYLENRLREELSLGGVPVRLVIRRRGET
jgi:GTP-binding protein